MIKTGGIILKKWNKNNLIWNIKWSFKIVFLRPLKLSIHCYAEWNFKLIQI